MIRLAAKRALVPFWYAGCFLLMAGVGFAVSLGERRPSGGDRFWPAVTAGLLFAGGWLIVWWAVQRLRTAQTLRVFRGILTVALAASAIAAASFSMASDEELRPGGVTALRTATAILAFIGGARIIRGSRRARTAAETSTLEYLEDEHIATVTVTQEQPTPFDTETQDVIEAACTCGWSVFVATVDEGADLARAHSGAEPQIEAPI